MGLFPLGILGQGGGGGGLLANWFSTLSSANAEGGMGVYVDASNNTYIASETTSGNRVGVFIKLDPSLSATTFQNTVTGSTNIGWTRMVSNGTDFYAGGYVIVSGRYVGLIAKYDASGTLLWQRQITQSSGSIGQCYIIGMTVDASGNVYAVGYAFLTTSSIDAAFTLKYDTSGTLQWIRSNGDNSTTTMYDVAADSSGNVYSVGQRSGNGGVMQRYNASGTGIGSLAFFDSAGTGQERFLGISLDSSANCYIVGANANNGNLIVVKTNSSNTVQWQRLVFVTAPSAGTSTNTAVVADSSGNSFIAVGNGSTVHLLRYNTSGTIQWQRSLVRTSGTIGLQDLALDTSNNLIVTGTTNLNAGDIFTIKVPTDGSKTGTYSVGGGTFTYAASSLGEVAGGFSSGTNASGGNHTLSSSTGSNSTGTVSLTLSKIGI